MRILFLLLLLAAPGILLAQEPASNASQNRAGKWSTPRPFYPYVARAKGEQGDSFLRISTDGSGHVVRAVMVKPSGSSTLDENTINFAKAHWQGPPNSTITLPVNYRLQGGVVSQKWHTPALRYPLRAR